MWQVVLNAGSSYRSWTVFLGIGAFNQSPISDDFGCRTRVNLRPETSKEDPALRKYSNQNSKFEKQCVNKAEKKTETGKAVAERWVRASSEL